MSVRLPTVEGYLAAIIQSSDDAIVSKDLNGIVTSWNPAAERMFGFSADEMIGQSIRKIIPSERLSEEDHVLSRVRAGLGVDHFETVRRCKDGSPIEISLTVSPIRDRDGTIVGVSKVARDITERNRLLELRRRVAEREEEERRANLEADNRRMREASRLKSEFVANMSHELRTPLNSIIGFAELLHDGRVPPDSPKYEDFLGHLLASAKHLLRLINDILDLARVESGHIEFQPQHVDLRLLVAEVRDVVRGLAAARGIEIETDVDPTIDGVSLDPSRLKQVLYNFLSNAVKFTPERGRIAVRVRPADAGRFRLEVEDTGIGIAAEDLGRLFIEFQQLDASPSKRYQGTGLGLALTKRIVEAQGGVVGVESTPGVGSTFFAIIPSALPAMTAQMTSVDSEEKAAQ